MMTKDETYVENYSFLSLNKRPRLLNVLLLMSSIFILSTLTAVTQKLIDGPMTQVQIETQMSDLYGTTVALIAQGADQEFVRSTELIVANSIYINNEVFYLSNITLLVSLAIGLISIFLMFFMIKTGFYIYIIYSILPLAAMYLTTPLDLILDTSVMLIGFSGLIMVALYCISLRDILVKR